MKCILLLLKYPCLGDVYRHVRIYVGITVGGLNSRLKVKGHDHKLEHIPIFGQFTPNNNTIHIVLIRTVVMLLLKYNIDVANETECQNVEPQIYGGRTIYKQDTCFQKYTSRKTWFKAKEKCEEKGGFLLEVHIYRAPVSQTLIFKIHDG